MNREQISQMLHLQDDVNTRITVDWRNRNNPWYRAIWTECAEMLDHYGWKWWKKQQPNIAQVRLELVDIWHFGLSDLLQHRSLEEAINVVDEASCNVTKLGYASPESKDFRDAVEEFSLETLRTKTFEVASFFALCGLASLDLDRLYMEYIGKNVLNVFRQDHGYATGEYVKIWDGREDNEHLEEIFSDLSVGSQFAQQIYQELKRRYPALRK